MKQNTWIWSESYKHYLIKMSNRRRYTRREMKRNALLWLSVCARVCVFLCVQKWKWECGTRSIAQECAWHFYEVLVLPQNVMRLIFFSISFVPTFFSSFTICFPGICACVDAVQHFSSIVITIFVEKKKQFSISILLVTPCIFLSG